MAEVSATLVKTLREKTGAGMMDCKKALNETAGDLEAAVDWLRKKGLAAASKKAGRVAAEGLVGVASKGTAAAVVEINAETDFVGRNVEFQNFVQQVATLSLSGEYTPESLTALSYHDSVTVGEELTRLIAVIGENMNIRRVQKLQVEQGVVATYIHSAVSSNLGRIGVLVALESSLPAEPLMDLGRKLAMHIAAAHPQALSIAEIDPAAVARERAVLSEQARASGRSEDVIEKMVEGRLRKYYEEVVLLEQVFVVDGKTKVSDLLELKGKELGASIKLKGFVRFALGEGIEKESSDFAAEVQAQAQKTIH